MYLSRRLVILTAPLALVASCAGVPDDAAPLEGPVTDVAEAAQTSAEQTGSDPTPTGDVAQVVRVIDGDTIVVALDGFEERVRVIGIDTPERGDCGFAEASEELERLLAGGLVELLGGIADDRDRYDRLLRYLEVDGTDIGYLLIREGYAHAAYDSRSGYERHPREDVYVSADNSSSDLCP